MSAPTLAQKVSNVKHMPVLLAATSATKNPADGYLVKDIIKMSFESYQTRLFLLQYLLNQLITSNNVYSKIKILQLFLVLLEEGHIEFKQTLRRNPEAFNEAAKLRPHQPKDQKLVSECGRIRDMANKILDSMYSEVPEMRSRPGPTYDSSSAGLSGESSSSGGKGGDGGGSRITGFGNTGPSKPTNLVTTTTDKLKSLFGTSGKASSAVVYDPSYATMDPVPHNTSANSPFSVHVPASGASSNKYQGGDGAPSGAPHERGQAGGGWSSGGKPPTSQSSFKPAAASNQWSGDSYASEEEEREHLSSTGEDLSSYEQTSMEQEQRLVDDITAPGGVRAAPPRESLNKFILRCKVLDALSVVDCLRPKLQSTESQVVLRTLFVIEALLRSNIPDVLSHLDIVLQDLSDLTSSSNSSIQAKAKKILVQLTSANVQRVAYQHEQQVQQPPPPSVSGRDEAEDEQEETDGAENSGLSSIFSGLSVSGGEKGGLSRSPRPAKPAKKKVAKQQPSPRAAPRVARPAAPANEKTTKERSGFEDILGLGDLSSGADAQTPGDTTAAVQQAGMLTQQLMSHEVAEEEEDGSLLTFEEDVEFDPLKKRSDSLVASTGSDSVATRRPLAADQEQPVKPPPLTSQESIGHIQDLTGVDLTSLSSVAPPLPPPQQQVPPQVRQDSFTEMLLRPSIHMPHPSTQMPHPSSIQMPNAVVSSAGMVSHPGMQFVSAPPVIGGQGGPVPMALLHHHHHQGGLTYGGGGASGIMYAAPGNSAGVMYQSMPPQFGGVARPVQRAAVSKEQTPPPDTNFSFLGKSNKSNAFDFVQDEMKATGTKK